MARNEFSGRDTKTGTALIMLSGLAKLNELERRRQLAAVGVSKHTLSQAEARDYERLRSWWNAIGMENQDRIRDIAEDLSKEIQYANIPVLFGGG